MTNNIFSRLKNPSNDAQYLVYHYIKAKTIISKNIYKRLLIKKYNIFLSTDIVIGRNLSLPHPTGIVIGKGAVIDNNVTIYQQVTIGGKNVGDTKSGRIPHIKDGAVLFAGSKILGNITVGRNSQIGANSVLLESTEDDSVYAGVPARKIK